jgi:hypothetical protein
MNPEKVILKNRGGFDCSPLLIADLTNYQYNIEHFK